MMKLGILAKIAGVLALTAGLAGCMDVTMDIEVQSDTNAKATTTMVMSADFYAMAKAGMAASAADASKGGSAEEEGFCKEEGSVLTENADGSATCTLTVEGDFAELSKNDDGTSNGKYEVVAPGVVKVSFSTKDMQGELGSEEAQDEETKKMMQAFFEGHTVTIRIRGKEITDTNMTKSADGTSAEIVMPFLDLINGTANLPETVFATVKTN